MPNDYQPHNVPAPMGHNKPPSDLEILAARLEAHTDPVEEYERLKQRQVPEAIEDEQQAGEITLYLKAAKALESQVEAIHKKEKAPYLECGRRVDGWKTDFLAKVSDMRKPFEGVLKAFLDKKDAEERERRLEAAKQAEREAQALREQSAAHETEGLIDTATELLQASHDESRKADTLVMNAVGAAPGSFAKARTGGASAGLKAPWVGEITDVSAIDLEKLRWFFSEDSLQKAINAFVRDGGRQLNGVNIYQQTKLNIR